MFAKVICLLLIAMVFPKTEARLRRPGNMKSGKPSTVLAEALDLDASKIWNVNEVTSLVWAYVRKHNLSKLGGTFNEKRGSQGHHRKSSVNLNEDTFQTRIFQSE